MAYAVVDIETEETTLTLNKEELYELVEILKYMNLSTGSNVSMVRKELVESKHVIETEVFKSKKK